MAKDEALKLQKRKLREEKEIARLEKEKSKPKFVGYIFLFLFIITIVYLVDEITTNIGKFMELDVAVAFFGGRDTYDAATTTGLIGTLITAVSGSAMLLRPLADRFGRKIFLFIYTFGMSVAMGLIAISHSIPGWVIGTLLIQACIPHDMQQVYIQECAPKEKRGIIADKLGRKKTSIFFAIGALVFYVGFYLGSMYGLPAFFNGLFLGAACGAVWSFGDLLLLMISESSETNLRVSANTTCLFAAGLCYTIAKTIVEAICKGMGSDELMGVFTIIVVVIGLTASIITTTLKVKETNGVDLNTITAKDYE